MPFIRCLYYNLHYAVSAMFSSVSNFKLYFDITVCFSRRPFAKKCATKVELFLKLLIEAALAIKCQ